MSYLSHPVSALRLALSRPVHAGRALLMQGLLAVLLSTFSACGDPGTGGSGIPSSASSNGSTSNAGGSASLPAATDFQVRGIIDAIDAQSVTISGQAYAGSQLDIVLNDGSAGNLSALRTGQSVGLNPVSNSTPARWSLRILSP